MAVKRYFMVISKTRLDESQIGMKPITASENDRYLDLNNRLDDNSRLVCDDNIFEKFSDALTERNELLTLKNKNSESLHIIREKSKEINKELPPNSDDLEPCIDDENNKTKKPHNTTPVIIVVEIPEEVPLKYNGSDQLTVDIPQYNHNRGFSLGTISLKLTHYDENGNIKSFSKKYPNSYDALIKQKTNNSTIINYNAGRFAKLFQDYADKSGFSFKGVLFWHVKRHHGKAAGDLALTLRSMSDSSNEDIMKTLVEKYLYITLVSNKEVKSGGSFHRRLDYSMLQLSHGRYSSVEEYLEANQDFKMEFKETNGLLEPTTNNNSSDSDIDYNSESSGSHSDSFKPGQ